MQTNTRHVSRALCGQKELTLWRARTSENSGRDTDDHCFCLRRSTLRWPTHPQQAQPAQLVELQKEELL